MQSSAHKSVKHRSKQLRGKNIMDDFEKAILELTNLIELAHYRDRAYRFLMAYAGAEYQPDYIDWLEFYWINQN